MLEVTAVDIHARSQEDDFILTLYILQYVPT